MTLCVSFLTGVSAGARDGNDVYEMDSTAVGWRDTLSEVVVTGTRNETDVRHLPMTVSVVDRPVIEYSNVPSLLPVLTEQVPGFFTTSRGIMGYGVSDGAAGTISIRGLDQVCLDPF